MRTVSGETTSVVCRADGSTKRQRREERFELLIGEVVGVEIIGEVQYLHIGCIDKSLFDLCGGVASGRIAVEDDDDPSGIGEELSLRGREVSAEQSDGGNAELV